MLPPSTVVDVGGGLERHGMVQKGLRHVLGRDLAAEKIAGHVVGSLTPRALARAAISSGVKRPLLMRSALTALARMPSAP